MAWPQAHNVLNKRLNLMVPFFLNYHLNHWSYDDGIVNFGKCCVISSAVTSLWDKSSNALLIKRSSRSRNYPSSSSVNTGERHFFHFFWPHDPIFWKHSLCVLIIFGSIDSLAGFCLLTHWKITSLNAFHDLLLIVLHAFHGLPICAFYILLASYYNFIFLNWTNFSFLKVGGFFLLLIASFTLPVNYAGFPLVFLN